MTTTITYPSQLGQGALLASFMGATLATAVAVKNATDSGPVNGIYTAGYGGYLGVEWRAVGTVAAQAATWEYWGSYDGVNFDHAVEFEDVEGVAPASYAPAGTVTKTPGNGVLVGTHKILLPYPYIARQITANSLNGTGAGLILNLYGLAI